MMPKLWTKFADTLLVDLGAYTTVVELLEPLAADPSADPSAAITGDLAIAYASLERYEEAIRQETRATPRRSSSVATAQQ